MNSTVATVKRWIKLDAALAGHAWMNVPFFARKHGVSTRTIHRDLKAFRQLGQKMEHKHPWSWEVRDYTWRYAAGVEPLFTVNARRNHGAVD